MVKNSDIDKVKLLREETGLSFNEIKRALDAAGGDEEKARQSLKSYGASVAGKKSAREVHEGVVDAYIHSTRKTGVLLELLCETDFVARNEEFRALAHDITMHVAAMKPQTTEELMAQAFVKDPSVTIRDLVDRAIGKLGENIKVGQFTVFEL